MGFVFLLLLIILAIIAITSLDSDSKGRLINCSICGLVSTVVALMLLAIIWGGSWSTYVGLQGRAVTIEQYRHTIEIYADKGVAEFKINSSINSEFTDLKYQNYQTKLANMITELRWQVVKYNRVLVGKRVSKANWFWSWCIVAAPDDFKVIKMEDYGG